MLGKVGTVAGGVLVAGMVQNAAARVKALISSTVEAASSLGESVNAVNKMFDSQAGKIQEWGQKNAASFGLSTRAFNQAATPLGAMLKNTGMSMDDVSEHTLKLTKRAADVASVFNVQVMDVLVAIQAGLRGEQDPLERFGVSLSAAAVEARALADTGKTSAAALTSQEKAAARLAVIYEQTADSAGDFADTSTGLANAQRVSAAEIENTKAKIGTVFIPIMAQAAIITGKLAAGVGAVPGPALLTTAAVIGLAGALAVLAPRVVSAGAALRAMATSESLVQRGMARTAVLAGKLGIAMVGLAAVGAVVGAVVKQGLNPQVDAATTGLEQWNRQSKLSGEAARLFGDDVESLGDGLQFVTQHGFGQALTSFGDWTVGLVGVSGGVDELRERVAAFDQILKRMVEEGNGEQAFALLQLAAEKANISVDEAKTALPGYTGALEVAAAATANLGKVTAGAVVDLDKLDAQFDSIIEKSFALEETQDAAADAIARLTEQVKQQRGEHEKGAGSLDRNTQAGRDNAASVRGLVADYEQMIIANQKAGLASKGLAQKLQDQLVQMGFTRAEAQRYTKDLAELEKQIGAIPNKVVTVSVRTQGGAGFRIGSSTAEFLGGGLPHRAAGGPGGGWTTVGEYGPERVKLPYGSMVYPTSAGAPAGPSVAAPAPAPTFLLGSDGSRLGDALLWLIANTVRLKGGRADLLGIKT